MLRPLFFVVEKYAPTHAHKLIDITPPYLLKKKGGNAPLPTNKNKLGPSFLKKKKWKMCHGLQKESPYSQRWKKRVKVPPLESKKTEKISRKRGKHNQALHLLIQK